MPTQLDLKGFAMDHIGVAVRSLDEGFQFYRALGYERMEVELVPEQKVRVGFLPLQNQMNIELLESTEETGPIAKFLARRGPGLHHICLRVHDIRGKIEELAEQGIQLIDRVPKRGAHGCLVAFVHPASAGGVLIELSEKLDP